MPFGTWTLVGPGNHVLDGVKIHTREVALLRKGQVHDMTGHVRRTSRYSKRLSRGQNRYGADADWGGLDEGAHWRHMVNAIEPFVCGGDVA